MLGIKAGNFALLGCDLDSFRGFENESIPLKAFYGDENDNSLKSLSSYLIKRILPAFQDNALKSTLTADFGLS